MARAECTVIDMSRADRAGDHQRSCDLCGAVPCYLWMPHPKRPMYLCGACEARQNKLPLEEYRCPEKTATRS